MTAVDDRGTSTRDPGTWHQRAACEGVDVEVFFPLPANEKGVANALAFCRACPVADPCLAAALAVDDVDGIRGNTTPEQRRALIKARAEERPRAELQPCGTTAAYRRHQRRGERPCTACREADREHHRQRREAGDAA